MKSWLAVASDRSVRSRAINVALIVGSILALINHGEGLLAGTLTLKSWVQIGLTYVVPYCVSTYASVQAIRALAAK
jgi:hypothetical protein